MKILQIVKDILYIIHKSDRKIMIKIIVKDINTNVYLSIIILIKFSNFLYFSSFNKDSISDFFLSNYFVDCCPRLI